MRDISDFIDANDGEWRNSFASEGVLSLFGRGDEQYAAPFNFGPVGIWYNKALMEQAGLDPENPFTTWDEFLAAIEALQDAGITPIALGESEKWPGHFWFAYLALREGDGQAYADAFNRTGSFTGAGCLYHAGRCVLAHHSSENKQSSTAKSASKHSMQIVGGRRPLQKRSIAATQRGRNPMSIMSSMFRLNL